MKFNGTMLLSSVNVRKEKAGEDRGPTAADLKFTGIVANDTITELFSTSLAHNKLLNSLYNKAGDLTTLDVKKLSLAFEGTEMAVKVDPLIGNERALKFKGCKLDKIIIKPALAKTCELSFRVIIHPTADQLGKLSDFLRGDCLIDAEGQQSELKLEPPEPTPGEEGDD